MNQIKKYSSWAPEFRDVDLRYPFLVPKLPPWLVRHALIDKVCVVVIVGKDREGEYRQKAFVRPF